MTGTKVDLEIKQGADFEFTLTVKDSDGAPVDIAGDQFRGQARKTYNDNVVAFSFAFVVDPDQVANKGAVRGTLAPADTQGIELYQLKTFYVYDVEMVDTENKVTSVMYGDISLFAEVTR
jgi:hypothetical protein